MVLNEEQRIKELREKRIAYGISQGRLAWLHERKEAARAREEVERFEEDFNNDNSPYNS